MMESNRDSTNGYGTSGSAGASGTNDVAGAGRTAAGGTAYDTGAAYGGAYDTKSQRKGGVSGEMRNLIADVEDLLKGVANVGDADVAKLRARVTDTLSSAKDSLREGAESLRVHAGDAATTADTYVRERPWAAIGIAAGIGVVVGLWAGRRGGDEY